MAGRGRQRLDVAPAPRISVNRREAAQSLGMSIDFFEKNVQPYLCVIRRGSLRLFLIADLERWALEAAEDPMASELTA